MTTYDSRSSEAMFAFDLTFSFYRARSEKEFSFLNLEDANECSLITLQHLKAHSTCDKFDFYCRVEEIIKWNLETLKKIIK
jgi:hypothetical protein